MPSSTAARVACSASSTRAFFCFISASVSAPTEITATPPASLASRSLNFSLSYSVSVCSTLILDLADPLLQVRMIAGAFDNRRGALVDRDLLGASQMLQSQILELNAQVFADQRAVGQHRDVAQHRLAAVAEAWRLHRADVQHAAKLVDHQQRQRLRLDVLGDDQQRTPSLADLLQDRHKVANAVDLLLVNRESTRSPTSNPCRRGD